MSARDDLATYAITTRTVTADGLTPYIEAHHAETLTEGARLLEDAACDADWNRTPDYCQGLRAGAELLLAKTTEAGATPAAGPEFFQPGHTYAREHHGRTIEFLVRSTDTAPGSSYRVARGWRLNEDGDWEPTDSDDLTGWTDVTEAGGS